MKLCPVDLAQCDRVECGSHCRLAQSPRLTVCWECGMPEPHGVAAGICIACVALRAHDAPRRPG